MGDEFPQCIKYPRRVISIMLDVLSIGDSTIDTFLKVNDAHVMCSIDKQGCKFCVNYADKIIVESLHQSVAGNAANNAIGSSRLGLQTSIYTTVGSDFDGKKILSRLKKERVSTNLVKTARGMESNKSTAINFHAERTLFVYHQPWNYHLPKLPPARMVYYTSMGKDFASITKNLLSYVKKNNSILAINLGSHQRKSSYPKIKAIIEATTLFFFNKEEAAELLGLPHSAKMKELLAGVKKLGPKIVVITDGPNGSTCFDGKNFLQLGIFNVPVIERTGVGDAFSTAFSAAYLAGFGLPTCLKWGTINSSGVIQKIGPIDGLHSKNEIQKILGKNPRFTKAGFW
ncbi:carbohydrate kinase family protein [Candidatus Micrarchaeota archaeon]|nr:carbohydrate kinase family protein [Candidatus Micrarchaeota archaeon]